MVARRDTALCPRRTKHQTPQELRGSFAPRPATRPVGSLDGSKCVSSQRRMKCFWCQGLELQTPRCVLSILLFVPDCSFLLSAPGLHGQDVAWSVLYVHDIVCSMSMFTWHRPVFLVDKMMLACSGLVIVVSYFPQRISKQFAFVAPLTEAQRHEQIC